jgi:hypothetical protein
MKMKGLICLLLTITLFSCNQEADKVAQMEKEVLAIHDEVMPKMDDIMSLQSKLVKKMASIDSLQQEGVSSTRLAEQRIKAFELNRLLKTADSLMMNWMYTYRGDSAKGLQPAEAMLYFEKEKEKIVKVKETTNSSIDEVKMFLK